MKGLRSGALLWLAAISLQSVGPTAEAQITGDGPWADDPAVQAVLAQRRAGLEAMMAGTMSAETERYSSTFVANTPNGGVVTGEEIVVPGGGAANAGQRVRRRFTDVFRRENGEWRHDLRHANVIAVE